MTLASLGLTWETAGNSRVGVGSVTWIRVAPTARNLAVAPSASSLHPIPAAMGVLAFAETEQVPEVIAENAGLTPLLVPPHIVLSGGWQARIAERAVVLPPDSTQRIPVKAVEAGRWGPRDEQTGRVLAPRDRSSIRVRWSLARLMASQLEQHGRFTADQEAVWPIVDEALARDARDGVAPADPNEHRSYDAHLDGVRRAFVTRAREARVTPPEDVNGMIVFPRGGGFWLEVFPSRDALVDHADDLLADLFDTSGDANLTAPITSDGEWRVDVLWRMPLVPTQPVPGTLGESYAVMGGPGSAVGEVVVLEGALAHASLGAPPPVVVVRGVAERSVPGGGAANEPDAARAIVSSLPVERPRVDVETMRAMFLRAARLFPESPPEPHAVRGFRLVRVLERSVSWIDVRIDGDGYAVCGSHDRCDLVLSQDSGIWLRQLVAVAVRLEDGTVGMRLIDLKTDLPFFLEDDLARWSVLARGTFAVRLGRHVLCGFPIGAPSADGAAQKSMQETATTVRAPESPHPVRGSVAGDKTDANAASPSPFQPLPAVVTVAPATEIQEIAGRAPSADHARVTLERSGTSASLEIPLDRLDSGVLVGRALNTVDGGLRRMFCEAISRVHVLLVRDAAGAYALDLCTTNGTRVKGRRIRRQLLADAGTTLELGKKVTLRWRG